MVDPVFLSLLCRELNEVRIRLGQPSIRDVDVVDERRDEIVRAFYLGAVRDLPKGVQRFVEDSLLTKLGFRDSVALENALSAPEVTEDALRALEARRLVRREERDGRVRIELVHDVLVDVVGRSRNARAAEEEAAKALAIQAAAESDRAQEAERARIAEAREKEAQQSARRARRSAFAARIAASVAVLLAIVSGLAWRQSTLARRFGQLIVATRAGSPTDVALQALAIDGAESEARALNPLFNELDGALANAVLPHGYPIRDAGFGPGAGQIYAVGGGVATLWRATDSGFSEVLRDSADATEAAISPDGLTFAVATDSDSIHVWNTDTATSYLSLFPGGEVAPPETIRVSVQLDKRLPASSGILAVRARCGYGSTTPLQFSADGRWIVRTRGRCLQFYSTLPGATGRQVVDTKNSNIRLAHVNPVKSFVATATYSGSAVDVWTTAGERLRELEHGAGAEISALTFVGSDSLLATATEDGRVLLWNYLTGRLLKSRVVEPQVPRPRDTSNWRTNAVRRIGEESEVGDGHRLLLLLEPSTYNFDARPTLLRWDLEDTSQAADQDITKPADGIAICDEKVDAKFALANSIAIAMCSGTDSVVALSIRASEVDRLNLSRTSIATLRARGAASAIAISRTGRWALAAFDDGTVRVWRTRGEYSWKPTAADMNILSVAPDMTSVLLRAGSPDFGAFLTPVAALDAATKVADDASVFAATVLGHMGAASHSLVFFRSDADSVWVWDVMRARGSWLHAPHPGSGEHHAYSFHEMALSPDGRWLLATRDSGALLWDLRRGSLPQLLGSRGSSARGGYSAAFSVGGDQLLFADWSTDSVFVWKYDKTSDQYRPRFGVFGRHAVFSPRGNYIATYGNDSVSLMRAGGSRLVLVGMTARADSVTFSSDERWLAIRSDSEVVVVATNEGRNIRRLAVADGGSPEVRFSDDGNWLAYWTSDVAFVLDLAGNTSPIPMRYRGERLSDLEFSPGSRAIVSGSLSWSLAALRKARSSETLKPEVLPGSYRAMLSGDRLLIHSDKGSLIYDPQFGSLQLRQVPSTPPSSGPVEMPGGEHVILQSGIYPITMAALMRRLKDTVHGCVETEDRMTLFGEAVERAEAHYRACLRRVAVAGGQPIDWRGGR
ncbi:MAG: WD40 repeat domain-containing protein [Gemmatimonadetes bacterium]|nr:WD40 repeat domain-containing protein [Gemmatimonadota bacterium]